MPNVIMLSAGDRTAVLWTSPDNSAALVPLPLTNGLYYVGPEVISDPVHGRSRTRLQGLSQVDYSTLAALIPGRGV